MATAKLPFEGLISFIQAPGEFIAEGLQKVILAVPQQLNCKLFFAYRQLNIPVDDLTAAIHRHYNVFIPAFHFKGYDIRIRHYYRTYIKVVRCYGGNYKIAAVRKYDGAITA